MRTSTTSDCEWSITGGILRARRILESNGWASIFSPQRLFIS
jgi:hypothetical protein